MESNHVVAYLINLLKNGIPQNDSALSNNLVYYMPRVNNIRTLQSLVRCMFESPVWVNKDLFELYEMSQAIVRWKLEISEPTISLQEFYNTWNVCFAQCSAWTPQKLAIIGGLLSTKSTFEYLQRNYFLDDSGEVAKTYSHWRNAYFMPVWCSIMNKIQLPSRLDEIVAIYSTVSDPNDVKRDQMPWDTVTLSLTRLSTNYIASLPTKYSPLARHLSQFVKTLQISIQKNSMMVISTVLGDLCRACFDLCAREVGDSNPRKNYMSEYYRNALFAVTIELNAILGAAQEIPENWYPQIIMCLFFTSFISRDIGVIGFESYEYVYDVATVGITMCYNQSVYLHVLDTMIGNVWDGRRVHSNKLNDAKRLFMLNYMERTLPEFSQLTPHFIEQVIRPMELSYINSVDVDVRESMHLVLLSLFQNSVSGDNLIAWQANHYNEYLSLATENFLQHKLSETQLIIFYRKMSSKLPLLLAVDKHLSRSTLHYTYLKILNCLHLEQKKVLLVCLIYQLPYVDKKFLIDWLDTCKELVSKIKFDKGQNKKILRSLWGVVSCMKSDTALKWWYGNIVPSTSYL